jgi:hypothetical protein
MRGSPVVLPKPARAKLNALRLARMSADERRL